MHSRYSNELGQISTRIIYLKLLGDLEFGKGISLELGNVVACNDRVESTRGRGVQSRDGNDIPSIEFYYLEE